MNPDDIKHLAKLGRIDVPDTQLAAFQKEFQDILGFVGQVKEVAGTEVKAPISEWRNIFSADTNANVPGEYTEKLLANAPAREEGYLVVKKIL